MDTLASLFHLDPERLQRRLIDTELGGDPWLRECGPVAIREVAAACGVPQSAAAFVGDDLPDIPAMRACGYPVAVADAVPEVRAVAAFVTAAPGGRGAVREVVEHLLRVQDRWSEALSMFDAPSAAGAGIDRPRSA